MVSPTSVWRSFNFRAILLTWHNLQRHPHRSSQCQPHQPRQPTFAGIDIACTGTSALPFFTTLRSPSFPAFNRTNHCSINIAKPTEILRTNKTSVHSHRTAGRVRAAMLRQQGHEPGDHRRPRCRSVVNQMRRMAEPLRLPCHIIFDRPHCDCHQVDARHRIAGNRPDGLMTWGSMANNRRANNDGRFRSGCFAMPLIYFLPENILARLG